MPAQDPAPLSDPVHSRFAAEWRAGGAPRIEDYIGAAAGPEREARFRALLTIEIEARASRGESVGTATYKSRFPSFESAVAETFRDILAGRRSKAADTSASRAKTRTDGVTDRSGPELARESPLPATVGRFEILQLLGEGGFGQVYRARDPVLGREVALKVRRSGILKSPADRERFLREARVAATLQHPNICPVHEVGQDGDRDYIVMAFVPGKSLAAILKVQKEPLPDSLVVAMVRKMALALDVAHQKGIVHRDLKPANVLYDRDRKELVVTDFGLARRALPGEAELTYSGLILGTPAYMAPEQARGDTKAVGPAADVYAIGVIMYELLTGRRPFVGSSGELIGQVLHVKPEPPSRLRPGLNPRLEAACMKAMAKDPASRYANMRDFAAALADCGRDLAADHTAESADAQLFAELTFESPPKAPAAARTPRSRRWAWAVGAGVAALVVLVGGVVFFGRTPTVAVLIDTRLDLTDRSLSFVLDGKPISAQALARPVELTAGEHDLVARRSGKPFHTFRVTAGRVAGKLAGVTELLPPPAEVSPPPAETVDDGFARWALSLGMPVTVQVPGLPAQVVRTVEGLPRAGVRVTEARATGCKNLTDANSGPLVDWLRRSGATSADLTGAAIGDATVQKLAAVPTVKSVVLKETKITNLALESLGTRADLTVVDVSSTGVTDDGLRKLKRALPNCQIRPAPKPEPAARVDEGFTPLFNGKNLAGWKVHTTLRPMPWVVEDGALKCTGEHSQNVLFTERGDYRDVHVRAECKFNALGAGGLAVRAQFNRRISNGYQVQIGAPGQGNPNAFTGSLRVAEYKDAVSIPEKLVQPGTWSTVELIVRGYHCTVRVNGQEVVDYEDASKTWLSGHIGLQFRTPLPHEPQQVLWFRRVEVKELPTAP